MGVNKHFDQENTVKSKMSQEYKWAFLSKLRNHYRSPKGSDLLAET